ncbi:MAG: response regulator [Deltaproteobacteria bacterium]|nr:response regulator [Deltaproteobacteria bacterium]
MRDTQPAPPPPIILVVEDDPDFRLQLAEVLRREGYAVRTASTAEEAIQAQSEVPPPALITLDLGLPRMTGTDFLRLKDQYYRWARIPVVVISAKLEEAPALRALVTVPKPVNWEALLDAIHFLCPIVGRGGESK